MKGIFVFLSLLLATNLYSQKYLSDKDFNLSPSAIYINDTFVKSLIGFNIKPEAGFYNVSKIDLPTPLIINGITYNGKIVVKTGKPIDFISLEDIRNQYFPKVNGNIIYMINQFFITKDAKSYKLDKDFIDRCELIPSSDFEALSNKEDFSIIRIFTKNYAGPTLLR